MQLIKDNQVKFSIWVNDEMVINNNAEVFTAEENDDTFFIFLKDQDGKEVKIKMEKSLVIKEN